MLKCKMKYVIIFLTIIFLLPLVNADSTFFDNPDSSFIMGNQEQSDTSSVSSSGDLVRGKSSPKKEPLNKTISTDREDTTPPDSPYSNTTKEDNILSKNTIDNNNKNYSPEEISINWNYILFFVIITLFCGVCFGIFKYRKSIKNLIDGLYRKYDDNSIKGLIKKKVYTDGGDYVGNVEEVVLQGNKIHSLKVRLDKRHKFVAKGVIIKYRNVRALRKIVIVDDEILSHLRNYKN